MPYALPRRLLLAGYFLVLTPKLSAQEAGDDPQRVTLTGLRHFAVSARVQLSGTGLESIDECALRAKLEAAMRREIRWRPRSSRYSSRASSGVSVRTRSPGRTSTSS